MQISDSKILRKLIRDNKERHHSSCEKYYVNEVLPKIHSKRRLLINEE